MQIVDFLLLNSCVKDLGPDFLIIPLDKVKFLREVKQDSLVKTDFSVPVFKDHIGLEMSCEKLSKVISVELSVVTESLK